VRFILEAEGALKQMLTIDRLVKQARMTQRRMMITSALHSWPRHPGIATPTSTPTEGCTQ